MRDEVILVSQNHHTYRNNTVDEGVVGLGYEAQAGRHVHDVGVEAPGTGVAVSGGQQHVLLRVQRPIQLRQLLHHLG